MRALTGRSTNNLTGNAPGGLRHSAITIGTPGGLRHFAITIGTPGGLCHSASEVVVRFAERFVYH